MKLKFPISQIKELSVQYKKKLQGAKKWKEELEIIKCISPAYRKCGYLTKKEFLKICHWKSPRPRKQQKKTAKNSLKKFLGCHFPRPMNSCEFRFGLY
jgi:hypothetical protein